MKGTNNNQLIVRFKNAIKSILFLAKSNKMIAIKELSAINNKAERFNYINKLVGVHQVKSEIIQFLEFAETNNPHAQILCEIGTANSGTAFFLGSSLQSIKQVICIDLFVKNTVQLKYFLQQKKVSVFNGSSYNLNTVKKVTELLNGKGIDILFIDGDHTYEGVKNDFTLYYPLVNKGGIIAFHDIVYDHFTLYGKQTGMWVGEVPKFWNEIKQNHLYAEFIEDKSQDGKGIGLIIKQ